MKRQIRLGEDSFKVQGKAFKRAYLLLQKQMNAGQAQTSGDINLPSLRAQILVEQEGASVSTSFNAVGPVLKYCAYNPNEEAFTEHLFAASGTSCRGLVTGTLTSLVIIPLLETFLLKGGDCITFNISTLSSIWGANVDVNASGIYLVIEEGNDLEQLDINVPSYEPITIDKQSPSWQYNGISRIAVLNGNSANPVNYVEITSQQVNERFDTNQQDVLALDQGKIGLANLNSVRIYDFEPSCITDVTVNMNVDTANVATGANFLYVEKVVSDKGLVYRAIAHSEKVKERKLKQRGVGIGAIATGSHSRKAYK